MGGYIDAGQVPPHHVPAEEDKRAGVSRCIRAGHRIAWGKKRKRACFRETSGAYQSFLLDEGRRHQQAHHVPLRPAHVRGHDAGPWHGPLHGEQAARAPGNKNHADLRQGARQDQTGGHRPDTRYLIVIRSAESAPCYPLARAASCLFRSVAM